ncbi:MAG: hypothetical protein QOF62_3821 [Pyrinomonadaceae bacterium]|jgi:hypothetical protein|nr:hypothetical protein [Pyrinomonadaceae bacterium]
MKRWQKLLLVLLAVLICSQIPFAYRRYRLGRLSDAILQINSQRQPRPDEKFVEYKGVVHVHSFLGGHSTGTFEAIIAAAKQNQLDFVVMTEHTSANFNTAAMTLKDVHSGVLFINGNEVSAPTNERLLIFPGDESAITAEGSSVADVIARSKARSALALVAYPEEFKSWSAAGYDGVEVYNVYTNARQINPLVMLFDGLWSYRSYPDLLFATFYARPANGLRLWDDAIRLTGKRLVATAGNDAHANVGLSLNDASGKTWVGFKADPYERSFHLVRMHLLLSTGEVLNSSSLVRAFSAGHCFIGFDLFGDTSGFRFTATNGSDQKIQGDEIAAGSGVTLSVQAPVSARVVLLKDGQTFNEATGIMEKQYAVSEKGSYRVEVYLPQLPGPVSEQPWIISNPIYVK